MISALTAFAAFIVMAISIPLTHFGFLAALAVVAAATAACISIICVVAMFVIDLCCESRSTERV